ncbi:MAG: hypothetical protein IT377_18475 [Polyangiaceae bacterium]|nr:hypothetical protein [Polyangiaceae bacterium]
MKPETIRKILSALLSFQEPCTSEQLALKVYGDSTAWSRSRKIVASAAGVAGRLRAMGLVGRTNGRWYVTESGRTYLVQAQVPAAAPAAARAEPARAAPRPAPGWLRWPAAPGGLLWFDGAGWWWPDGQGRWWPWGSRAR